MSLHKIIVEHIRKQHKLSKEKTKVIHSPSAEDHDFKKPSEVINDLHSVKKPSNNNK